MNRMLLFLLILKIGICTTLSAQSPYHLNWKKEIPFVSTAVGLNLTGVYLAKELELLTPLEIAGLNAQNVNSFDRFATRNYSTGFAQASNGLEIATQLAPVLFLTGKNTRKHFGQIIILYLEASFINTGVTIISKMTFRRTRPFVYNPAVSLDDKLTRTARTSFISGHTSTAAVGSFFAAKVFSDFYPDSKWKPVVWGAAAVIPGVMGYFRVAAGKHYPTDVIAGYLVGGTIGFLVPHLHRKNKNKDAKLSFDLGFNSARMVYQFGG